MRPTELTCQHTGLGSVLGSPRPRITGHKLLNSEWSPPSFHHKNCLSGTHHDSPRDVSRPPKLRGRPVYQLGFGGGEGLRTENLKRKDLSRNYWLTWLSGPWSSLTSGQLEADSNVLAPVSLWPPLGITSSAGLTLRQVSSPRGKVATSISALGVLWKESPFSWQLKQKP